MSQDAKPAPSPDRPEWALRQRAVIGDDTIAWDRFGDGPPVVLAHGTPSWSYLWRNIAPALAHQHTVYLLDLIGYGDSQKRQDQDMSIAAQSRALSQLLDHWQLKRPALVGHDIGAAIVLRTHLIEKRPVSRITVIDGAVFRPWNTPTTLHMKKYLDAYATMPPHIYERVVTGHLETATSRRMKPSTLAAYLRPWQGPDGQKAYFRKIAQWNDNDLAELEDALPTLAVPLLVLWGEQDAWLEPQIAQRFQQAIPDAHLKRIAGAGHFAMEDEPALVVQALLDFLAGT